MSIKIMTKVWDRADDVKGDALVVLLALADWANDDGLCWPKMATIAAKARITETAASHIVKRLQERGYLTVERGQGRGHQNTYMVHPRGDAASVSGPQDETEADAETDTQNPTLRNPFPENPFPENPFPETLKPPSRKPLSPRRAYKDEPSVLKPLEPSVCEYSNSPPRAQAAAMPTNGSSHTQHPQSPLPSHIPQPPVTQTRPDSRQSQPGQCEPEMVDISNPNDPRFTTPYYPAVAKACGLREKPLDSSKRTRGQIAFYAAELERLEYSVEQIAEAGTNWRMDDPPTPQQLFDRIDNLLRPKTNGATNGTHQRQHQPYQTAAERKNAAWERLGNEILADAEFINGAIAGHN